MAVLSHALLLLASVFASPLGAVDSDACQRLARDMCESCEAAPHDGGHGWAPRSQRIGVRVYDVLRARGSAPLRVVGRFAFKTGPEEPTPELMGWPPTHVDKSHQVNLVGAHTADKPAFPRPVVLGFRPTEMHLLRAPVSQLERPPRV